MSERPISPQAVRFDRVTARYREVTALEEISFTVPAGEILALLGPSGCGKSTLLRAIAGFVPHSGDIYVGDRPTAGVAPHRRNIGMVFQDYALFPHMTVAQNIQYGLKVRGMGKAERVGRAQRALDMVRLTGLSPSPCDSAVVRSILPTLADQAGVDWTQSLNAWSKETMTSFLLLASRLISEAETARDHGPGKILKKAEFDEKTGDPIPF